MSVRALAYSQQIRARQLPPRSTPPLPHLAPTTLSTCAHANAHPHECTHLHHPDQCSTNTKILSIAVLGSLGGDPAIKKLKDDIAMKET